jgi:hypothetical protein
MEVAIGIWTLFGAGAFGLLASSSTIHPIGILFAVVAAVAVIAAYGGWFLPYLAETMRRDVLTSYYWESGV